MLVTTTEQVEGRRILQVLGLVQGHSMRARHVGADLMAAWRNLVGGEVAGYSRLLSGAREEALERMCQAAERLGANAVLGVRFSISMVMGGTAEILVYGTAVLLE